MLNSLPRRIVSLAAAGAGMLALALALPATAITSADGPRGVNRLTVSAAVRCGGSMRWVQPQAQALPRG
jgi:hypothetical protein